MPKSIQEWIREGEELYASSVKDLQELEAQMAELEARLEAKAAEVNQIAGIIGKPPVDSPRRVTAHLVEEVPPGVGPSNASATIARALAGKGMNR
ncbi:MAG TPA: hypothetical protein VL992_08230 [Tepidisphaeraceae bacterium]|nr:hypothetical protein [Tepidisphaeraceae bacterium]